MSLVWPLPGWTADGTGAEKAFPSGPRRPAEAAAQSQLEEGRRPSAPAQAPPQAPCMPQQGPGGPPARVPTSCPGAALGQRLHAALSCQGMRSVGS